MNAAKTVPVIQATAMNGADVIVLENGAIQFQSSDASGAGVLHFPDIVPWCLREGIKFPVLVKVDFVLSTGRVYAECFDGKFQRSISSQVTSRDGEDAFYLYVDQPENGAILMIGLADTPVLGKIAEISIASRESMDRAEFKRIRAGMFSHWYYTCDLGNGVSRSATIADEERQTTAALQNREIMLSMVEKHFGNLDGRRILDVACNAGLHSFELARRGAIVTGIDWDAAAIEQAKFIQECIGGGFRHAIDFRCTDLFDFDAPSESFDLVYCSGLFYHLQNPIEAAFRLAKWSTRGIVVECSVSPREGDLFELSDPGKFPFCASWEFALVPTTSLLQKIFERAGLKVEGMTEASEFPFDPDTWVRYRPLGNPMGCGPIYLALSPLQNPAHAQNSKHKEPDPIKARDQELIQLRAENRELKATVGALQSSICWRLAGLWRTIRNSHPKTMCFF